MKAPLFELPTIDGRSYKLADDIGKVIVITFWASWCPDCARDLPKKEQLYQSLNHDQVKMLTINVTGRERNVEEGIQYAKKYLTQLTLQDDGRSIYDTYNSTGVPTTVVINQDGYIEQSFGDKAEMMDIMKTIGTLL